MTKENLTQLLRKETVSKWLGILKPYQGILYFMVLLFGAHFLWKWVVDGDLHGQQIAIFGKDMTSFFYLISQYTARIIYWFVCLFPGSEHFRLNDVILYYIDGKMRLEIIWGCTGIKQLYIFIVIMLFYWGPIRKKLWYIPLGCLILAAYNVLRIACIAWLTRYHAEWFESLHEGLFRYIYYGLIFLLWVIWEEKIVNKAKPEKIKEAK